MTARRPLVQLPGSGILSTLEELRTSGDELDLGGLRITGLLGIKDTGGLVIVDFLATASSVNYIQWKNNATTLSPRIIFNGADTNVGGVLETKGSGRLSARYSAVNYELLTDLVFAAKGDLITATAAATRAVLSVGANGKTLTADSAEATGLAWASPDANPQRFLKAGTSDYTAIYVANLVAGVALSTLALTANRFYAIPFVAPGRGATADRIIVYVTTGAASSNIRLGIYSNLSESALYPDALELDAGASSSASSSTEIALTISQALEPGALYWLVLLSDGTPTIRAGSTNQAGPIMGIASLAGTAVTTHLYATQTYGSLPSTFPGSPTAATAAFPAIALRFSS
jgi:hypothetical protein